jgi:outer membrane protein TolC
MKMQFKQIILGVMLLGFCGTVFSQEPLRLTLKEAQDYALRHNRIVWNAGLSVSEAQKRTWETISAGLPQVNATVNYQNMMGFKMSFAGMDIAMAPTSNLQATVSQLLLSAGYWVGIKMSKIGENMSETARLQAELDVKHQTQSAYYAVLIAEESKKILEQNLKNIQALAQSTEDMVRVGVAEQTDADRMKLQVVTMVNAITMVERNIELAYNLLRFSLGVETDTKIELTETLFDDCIPCRNYELQSKNFDVNANYNMQLMTRQIDLADMQISLAKTASLPTVAAFYSYTHKIAKSTFDMSPNNVIGLQANIPIFASGQRHVRTQQARINLEKAQNSRDLLADQLFMQEKQLRFNLENAIESLELQNEAVNVSQRVFESVSRKFQQGTASSLDVTIASSELLQAQTNYINAMMQVFSAQTELEKLLNAL